MKNTLMKRRGKRKRGGEGRGRLVCSIDVLYAPSSKGNKVVKPDIKPKYPLFSFAEGSRSEERRVGKEC